MLAPLFAITAFLACAEDAPLDPAAADRLAYTRSATLTSTDPAAAAAACLEIEDLVLEGECATFAAKHLAKAKLDPLPLCEQVGHAGWQQVCFFESVDAAGLTGETAVAACRRAGEFRQRCLSHALSRESDRDWRRVAAGREREFLDWIEGRMVVYGLDTRIENIPRDFLARRVANRLAAQAKGQKPPRFSVQECGDVPADTCSQVYRQYVRLVYKRQDVQTLCQSSITREAVEATGLPGWEDDFQGSVSTIWVRLCKELSGGGRPPRGQR
jgi:hypothetical protein